MKVTINLTRWDIATLNWHLFRRRPLNFTFVLALIYFFYMTVTKSSKPDFAHIASALLVSVVGALLISLLSFVVSLIFVLLSSSKKSGTIGEHRYEITDSGLHEKTVANDSLYMWSGFKEITKTKSHLLLKVTNYLFHVIPRREFGNSNDYDAFCCRAKELTELAQQGIQADAASPRRLT